jgi:hypothetical protein
MGVLEGVGKKEGATGCSFIVCIAIIVTLWSFEDCWRAVKFFL